MYFNRCMDLFEQSYTKYGRHQLVSQINKDVRSITEILCFVVFFSLSLLPVTKRALGLVSFNFCK